MPTRMPHRVLAYGHSGVIVADRRSGYDRRRTTLRTFLQGGLTPRRRGGRRADDTVLLDWHEPHLLFMAVAILLLSVADALLTLTLLANGADELNPVMNYLLVSHPQMFAAAKMMMTGTGVLILVACARATVFRIVRVSTLMHWFLFGYAMLIGYEYWLLKTHP
ncbi:MAG: hypothetical protein JXB36_11820 [Gammaproteobacteria bacterium]|nr:hypothetical protein [Gammaproteobacteria bacterium]